MPAWFFIGGLAAGAALLAGRGMFRRSNQVAAASASGLAPAYDLSHVSTALQKTALWCLADGGFERRVVHGAIAREGGDIDVTAFDLETLRERRGEWAYLPVEPPFRIGGVVSVVVCEIDREFPHILLKRVGKGDELEDDNWIERGGHIAKNLRDRLGLGRSYPAEMPDALPPKPIEVMLPAHWRAYSHERGRVAELVAAGLHATLEKAGRRDLVIELIGSIVVVYPAARDVVGSDAFADLTSTALAIVDGIRVSSLSPRGLESQHS
ncbi:MAG: hypothetical protein JWO36_6613 [Myxococcales bacterium]|nr:hypothetical protein [Myxococcales bacterium]